MPPRPGKFSRRWGKTAIKDDHLLKCVGHVGFRVGHKIVIGSETMTVDWVTPPNLLILSAPVSMNVEFKLVWTGAMVEVFVDEVLQIAAQVLAGKFPSIIYVVIQENSRPQRMVSFCGQMDLNGWCRFVEHKLPKDKQSSN